MKNLLVGVVLATVALVAHADGPFGVSMGDPISKYPTCREDPTTPSNYLCRSLPKTHPDFESYQITAYPDTGVCEVAGVGNNIQDGGSGIETRAQAQELIGQLEPKYGKPTRTFDFQTGGSDDPSFWVLHLKERQQTYNIYWTNLKTESHVERIGILAKALSAGTTFLILRYEFENFDTCSSRAEKAKSDAL